MPNRRNTPLHVAAKGLLGGMGGALVLTAALAVVRTVRGAPKRERADLKTREAAHQGISAGDALAESPALPPAIDRVTAIFVQKVATGVFGTSLTPHEQYVAGIAFNLAYGGFWGVVYSLVRSSIHASDLSLIPAHGLVVWLIGPGFLLPRMDLMLYPLEQRPQTLALSVAGHIVYSAMIDLSFRWLQGHD